MWPSDLIPSFASSSVPSSSSCAPRIQSADQPAGIFAAETQEEEEEEEEEGRRRHLRQLQQPGAVHLLPPEGVAHRLGEVAVYADPRCDAVHAPAARWVRGRALRGGHAVQSACQEEQSGGGAWLQGL
eukprot:COSAG05_NODE_823_length_7122_cov_13.546917_4_plen_128_part_00